MTENVIKKRKPYPSVAQKARLISLLDADAELRAGKFTTSFTNKEASERWRLIGEQLNSIPGANKQWQDWRKTWQDMKAKGKKKQAVISSGNITGGGSPPQLTNQDEQVLNTMSDSAVVDADSQESAGCFDWEVHKVEDDPLASTYLSTSLGSEEIFQNADDEEPHAPSVQRRKTKSSAAYLIKNSLAVASALNKTLQEKNIMSAKKIKAMEKQTEAMNRQADALSRQADAMMRQAVAIEIFLNK